MRITIDSNFTEIIINAKQTKQTKIKSKEIKLKISYRFTV